MKNFSDMMKQAASLQEKMKEMQEKVADLEATGVAGGGMVQVVLNGKGFAKKMSIEPQLIKPDEHELLEDLICAAINDAKSKLDEKSQEQMKGLTDGLQLPPGMKLPF